MMMMSKSSEELAQKKVCVCVCITVRLIAPVGSTRRYNTLLLLLLLLPLLMVMAVMMTSS